MNTAELKKVYAESIAPALQKQFNYSSKMQIPVLKKIVVNQGLGDATQDRKIMAAVSGHKDSAVFFHLRNEREFLRISCRGAP